MRLIKSNLSGWGLSHTSSCEVFKPFQPQEMEELYNSLSSKWCFRGSGLSYGDAASLNHGGVVSTQELNKFINYDKLSGVIECQGGASLADIIDLVLPDNWMLGVVPGTPRATVGGCIACDIHGKNHGFDKTGSFGNSILEIQLLTVSDGILTCGPFNNEAIFWATIGGMGLTGLILSAKIRLQRIRGPSVIITNIPTKNLHETISLLTDNKNYEHRVAWIDGLKVKESLGAGFVSFGNYSESCENVIPRLSEMRAITFPGISSSKFVNSFSIRVFNNTILWLNRKTKTKTVEMTDFLFPFEKIKNWNNLFFSKGIVEYQIVVPDKYIHEYSDWFLKEMLKRHLNPYIVSMKHFGDGNAGLLSFPSRGFAFCASFSKSSIGLASFLDEADRQLVGLSGRVYLAKDCRLKPDIVAQMYPNIERFREVCDLLDPHRILQSDLSKRLRLRDV